MASTQLSSKDVNEIKQMRKCILDQCKKIQDFTRKRSKLLESIQPDNIVVEPESEITEYEKEYLCNLSKEDYEHPESQNEIMDGIEVFTESIQEAKMESDSESLSKQDMNNIKETLEAIFYNMKHVELRLHNLENEVLSVIQEHINMGAEKRANQAAEQNTKTTKNGSKKNSVSKNQKSSQSPQSPHSPSSSIPSTHTQPFNSSQCHKSQKSFESESGNREVIDTFNNTSKNTSYNDSDFDDLSKIDLDVGIGPDRSIRGTAIFSIMDI